jgi:hypothetical protein
MQLLKDYFKLEKEIKNYFGYEEQWRAIPLDDMTNDYWFITDSECIWSDEPISLDKILEVGPHYSSSLYGRKSVYEREDFTMVCVDTQTDGNIFLMIFDNAKKCKDPKVLEAYAEW